MTMPGARGDTVLRADHVLTAGGWLHDAVVRVGPDGLILEISQTGDAGGMRVGVLLPAPGNLHSHAFQRAMAGRTERRARQGQDSFWTWRESMYAFVGRITPDDLESIAAFAYLEMLRSGFAAVGEFHYLHHAADGGCYADIGEMSQRIAAAAADTGIGLTLLPVRYEQGGCDGRAPGEAQRRFCNGEERFGCLLDSAARAVSALPADARLGVAPHSMRAVPLDALRDAARWLGTGPVHLHVAEQTAEIDEVVAHTGRRPVQWLLEHAGLDARWCCVHATHMTAEETAGLAASGAVAGLCPITEANLGDGIFPAAGFLEADGCFGVGSDSNVAISLADELRLLEYSQRLNDRSRAVIAEPGGSVGRSLLERTALGGARALGRDAGVLAPGRLADMVALDSAALAFLGQTDDGLLDAWLFASTSNLVTDVWCAGRHVIVDGHHANEARIAARFARTVARLTEAV